MFYQEFSPSDILKSFIHVYAIIEEENTYNKPVLSQIPPGMGTAIIFSCKKEKEKIMESSVKGIAGTPYVYILPQFNERYQGWFGREKAIIAIIFKPGKLRKFFELPLKFLINRLFSFQELTQKELFLLFERLQEQANNNAKVDYLNAFFEQKLLQKPFSLDLVDLAIQEIFMHPHLHINDLPDRLNKSERQIRRTFKEGMGISPKTFQKIARINKAIHLIHNRKQPKLCDIAYEVGFFDHSHFDADFKEFIGKSPKEYLRNVNL